MYIVQRLCPGVHKGQVNTATASHQGEQKGSTLQNTTCTVHIALVLSFWCPSRVCSDKSTDMLLKRHRKKTTEHHTKSTPEVSHLGFRPIIVINAPRLPAEFNRQQHQEPVPLVHCGYRLIVLWGMGTSLFVFGQSVICPRTCRMARRFHRKHPRMRPGFVDVVHSAGATSVLLSRNVRVSFSTLVTSNFTIGSRLVFFFKDRTSRSSRARLICMLVRRRVRRCS